MEQIITFLASVAACLTAVSSFFVLIQNNKQRKESYKPQLIIKNIKFQSKKDEINTMFSGMWFSEDFNPNDKQFSLPIVNIGLGAAKQIKVLWSFDFEACISIINKEAQEALISAYFEYKNEKLNFVSKSFNAETHNWVAQKKQNIDYIIPISNSNEPVKLVFPMAIMLLYSFHYFCLSKKQKNEESYEFPKINVNLTYYDIGNKKHTEQFDVILNTVVLQYSENSLFHLDGYIETKKIK